MTLRLSVLLDCVLLEGGAYVFLIIMPLPWHLTVPE